ncbi:ACP S-malonyltransferase [Paenibacillus sp. FJAT-26967]|uniref:ACP S-malonyltransferase n=1 Tax=Paenibacillus sp. FJAT-26967 TaxID=1729690 RepID=UPI000837E70D|nr:ACP S-malonyltransferase [Paenibacillus sp. FJAT-26967]
MSKIAFVFPGQGAQAVGMGRDAYSAHAGAKHIFDGADKALGYSLSSLIFDGPEEELKMTYHTQPALLTTSTAYLEVLREKGIQPDYTAGHSLGEYSALVASGVLSFEEAVRVVRARGEFMEQAVPNGRGVMAAVLGAERAALDELCRRISSEGNVVELANVNCPGQIVVSGTREGVQAVIERAKEAGAKRAIALDVSGPFHSSLMKTASEQLAHVLSDISLADAAVPVVANVTARPVSSPDEIRELLVRQVYSPVLWEDTIVWLIEQGTDTFYEIGSGSVLAGLIKKVDRSVKVISINSLEAALQAGL